MTDRIEKYTQSLMRYDAHTISEWREIIEEDQVGFEKRGERFTRLTEPEISEILTHLDTCGYIKPDKKWQVARRHDLFFQDAWQGYIDSLIDNTDEPRSRQEWMDIIKFEDEEDHEITDDILEGLLDWLEEDGYVK